MLWKALPATEWGHWDEVKGRGGLQQGDTPVGSAPRAPSLPPWVLLCEPGFPVRRSVVGWPRVSAFPSYCLGRQGLECPQVNILLSSAVSVIVDTRLVLFDDVRGGFFRRQRQEERDLSFHSPRFIRINVIYSSLRMSLRNKPQLKNHVAMVFFPSNTLWLLWRKEKLEHDFFFNTDIRNDTF